MIASHALSLGLTLVTSDKAFSFVDELRTEDWTFG
jgi:predicted nucleic acid-binding protein